MCKFKIGDLVCLRHFSAVQGVVTKIEHRHTGNILVYVDGKHLMGGYFDFRLVLVKPKEVGHKLTKIFK